SQRQLEMVMWWIVATLSCQTCAGKSFCGCKAEIMLANRRCCASRQRQLVALMRGIQLVAIHTLRDLH
ncbi:hypothetical protein, partial [Salmonella enterica]|uniref:hypothetical protein n=1 Tax=Salmonella enterica TaxID=28901 RepID=UPI00398C29E9